MASRSKQQEKEAMKAAEQTGMDPAVMASAASVALSWYYFFVKGDERMGLFVGLWPPTFLAFASYFEQTRMSDMMKRATGQEGIVGKVERMVQSK